MRDSLPDRERKRQEAIFELITTEQAFVQSCQVIVQVFYGELEPTLGVKASAVVFANIEDIMLFGTTFLSDLEERQRETRLFVDHIGDLIGRYMDGLDVYRPYCTNQGNANKTLQDLRAGDPKIASKLGSLKVKGLELDHYLLQPMQRLTRYPLLLSQVRSTSNLHVTHHLIAVPQILKYTEDDHLDHPLLIKGLAKAQTVLTATNEAIRRQESVLRLATLSDILEFSDSDAVRSCRLSRRLEVLICLGAIAEAGLDRTDPLSRTPPTHPRRPALEGSLTQSLQLLSFQRPARPVPACSLFQSSHLSYGLFNQPIVSPSRDYLPIPNTPGRMLCAREPQRRVGLGALTSGRSDRTQGRHPKVGYGVAEGY